VHHQLRHRARGGAGFGSVGTAGQHDGHARAQHYARHQRIGQVFKLLGHHVAGLEVGHHQDVGIAGNRRLDALGLGGEQRNRIVEGKRAVEQAAPDLAAIGHLAQRGGVNGGADLGSDGLHRRQDGHLGLGQTEHMGELDRVLDDVDLIFEGGRDHDRRVGDHQRVRVGRHVGEKDVTDAASGAQVLDDLDHHLVGVQRPFHQGFGDAVPAHAHGDLGRGVAVLCIHDAKALDVDAELLGHCADLVLRADQDGVDQAGLGRLYRAQQRLLVARVRHRDRHRRQAG